LKMRDSKSASEYVLCVIGKVKLDRYYGEPQDFYEFGAYVALFNELDIIKMNIAFDKDPPGSHGEPPDPDVLRLMKTRIDQIAAIHHLGEADYCEAVVSHDMQRCKAAPLY
jgi:hypothetical protein